MNTPNDPVLQFILDPATRNLVLQGSHTWPYSRLSGSRLDKIGYRLVVLRCAQLGIDIPTRDEVIEWVRNP